MRGGVFVPKGYSRSEWLSQSRDDRLKHYLFGREPEVKTDEWREKRRKKGYNPEMNTKYFDYEEKINRMNRYNPFKKDYETRMKEAGDWMRFISTLRGEDEDVRKRRISEYKEKKKNLPEIGDEKKVFFEEIKNVDEKINDVKEEVKEVKEEVKEVKTTPAPKKPRGRPKKTQQKKPRGRPKKTQQKKQRGRPRKIN